MPDGKGKADVLINLDGVNDSFSEKPDDGQKLNKERSKSRLVMLPQGVIEDTKGEENASEDAGRSPGIKRRVSKDIGGDYDIEKNSYFKDSSERDKHSEKDGFNSSLGGWDINENHETKKSKKKI